MAMPIITVTFNTDSKSVKVKTKNTEKVYYKVQYTVYPVSYTHLTLPTKRIV